MSKTKGGGSTRNGRDSNSKRLGVKVYDGQDILAGFVFKTPLFYGLDEALKELFREERVREISPIPAGPKGSNGFAVSRSRSDDETTRLFVNSHQPWKGAVTWYEAHLVSEEGVCDL